MAMIPCPSCGEMISDKSPKCIHCGYEFTPQTKLVPNVVLNLTRQLPFAQNAVVL